MNKMVSYKFKLMYILLMAIGCSFINAEELGVKRTEIPFTTLTTEKLITEKIPVVPADVENMSTSTTTPMTAITFATTITSSTTLATTTIPVTTATSETNSPATSVSTKAASASFLEPSIGKWNSNCIMVKMAAQLNFTYYTMDNKQTYALLNVPAEAKVCNSSCDAKNTQNMRICWGSADAVNMLTLQFDRRDNLVEMTMMSINIPLTSTHFPDAKQNQTIELLHSGSDFAAPRKMSYHCSRAQELKFKETIVNEAITGKLTVRNVQVQAFHYGKINHFAAAYDCDRDETDAVPILVGFALLTVIIIVLILHLRTRHRPISHGYMSF